MAASAACNPIGAAMAKFGSLVQQEASTIAEGSLQVPLLTVGCRKSMKGADMDGGHLNNQASRFASIAVAATAWVGLSMCPIEALAMAYIDGDHRTVSYIEGDLRNVGEAVPSTSTTMLHLSGYIDADTSMWGEFIDEDGVHELDPSTKAIATANVPSIKPPNEGLNSPWIPKINGSRKKVEVKSKGTMRCPKWTESELEMVLPDFQGRPKPFPRMQGPFWPATAPSSNGDNETDDEPYRFLVQDKLNQPNVGALFHIQATASSSPSNGAHDEKKSPSSPAPPPQQHQVPIKKLSCYTM